MVLVFLQAATNGGAIIARRRRLLNLTSSFSASLCTLQDQHQSERTPQLSRGTVRREGAPSEGRFAESFSAHLNFDNTVKPVIALYESLGLSKKDLITVLLARPTLISRTNLNDEKLEYIRRTGVSRDSKMHKHVVSIVAASRMETIREKVMNMERYGMPEDDYLGLIGRSPLVLTLSVNKIQRNMTYVLGTMNLSANVVLHNPFLIFFNLETVLKPRFQVACKIEDMGVVPQIKGALLLRALRMSDKRFIKAFILCHPEKLAEELLAVYRDAKCVRRLAESSKKLLHAGFPF